MKQKPQTWAARLQGSLLAAFNYWEPKRLFYNLILACVTVLVSFQEMMLFFADPSIREFAGLFFVFGFFCVVANILYCAAYVPDIVLQLTPIADFWRRFRWTLFAGGTGLACACVIGLLYIPHGM